MKKIILMTLILFLTGTNFIFADTIIDNPCTTNLMAEGCPMWKSTIQSQCSNAGGIYQRDGNDCSCTLFLGTSIETTNSCESVPTAAELKAKMDALNASGSSGSASNSPMSVMGITCSPDQLVNGQCKLNIYDTLGIRKSVRNKDDATSVGLFVQDVILSATFFIGTLVTVALIVSGLMFIFAASSGKDPANAKKGIIGSLVGLLIVVSSYVIIRLVQYIAKGF